MRNGNPKIMLNLIAINMADLKDSFSIYLTSVKTNATISLFIDSRHRFSGGFLLFD